MAQFWNNKKLHDKLHAQELFSKPVDAFINIVKENQKRGMKVAEVGVWCGETTCHYAHIVQNNDGIVYAIDWFKGTDATGCPGYTPKTFAARNFDENNVDKARLLMEKNLKDYNVADCVDILQGISHEIAKEIPDKSLDICFIDADHSYESVYKDIIAYFNKVKVGGILCGHDYNSGHPGVMRATHELIGIDNITIVPDPLGNLAELWLVNITESFRLCIN